MTALGQQALGSVGQNAEVTHPHKALRNHVEQEAADKFSGGAKILDSFAPHFHEPDRND